jgi:AcrR family transcriptional regulator
VQDEVMDEDGSAARERMLAALRPADLAGTPARWQQRKSVRTRMKLVEAAIDCLVEGGYARLTTQAVAERTGSSRGAMHHHFPSRADLVAAVIDHVFYERMRLYLGDYLSDLAGLAHAEVVARATAAHWRSVQTREYAAYLELAVAARTDAELDQMFAPASRRYDEVWLSEMTGTFPFWEAQWEAMLRANDFVIAAHMGMLIQRTVMGEARTRALGEMIEQFAASIYRT